MISNLVKRNTSAILGLTLVQRKVVYSIRNTSGSDCSIDFRIDDDFV